MKKIIILFAILFSYHSFVLASTTKCKKSNGVHCAYYEGDQSQKNGKYVKSTLVSNGRSNIYCTRGGFSDFIPQPAGKGWGEGKKEISYEQCLNAECKTSKHLGTDTFTIVRNDQGYTSNPQNFRIRLLNNYGEPCTTWK